MPRRPRTPPRRCTPLVCLTISMWVFGSIFALFNMHQTLHTLDTMFDEPAHGDSLAPGQQSEERGRFGAQAVDELQRRVAELEEELRRERGVAAPTTTKASQPSETFGGDPSSSTRHSSRAVSPGVLRMAPDGIGTLPWPAGFAATATFFVGLAAYRDTQCHRTMMLALSRAAHPDRVHFGIFQQHDEAEDPDCVSTWVNVLCDGAYRADNEYQLSEAQAAVACEARQRIRMQRVSYLDAKGPTWGRHKVMAMVDPAVHDFFLQIDSHSLFVGAWDYELMRNYRATGNPRAVISTYPKPHASMQPIEIVMPNFRNDDLLRQSGQFSGPHHRVVMDEAEREALGGQWPAGFDPNVAYLPATVATVCALDVLEVSASHMIKFHGAHVLRSAQAPMRTPFFAAGLAFAPAAIIARVHYDCCTPMLFDGEEFSFTARLYTHGYDIYAPFTDPVYHIYETGVNPKYWQVDWEHRFPIRQRSEQRVLHMLGLDPVHGTLDEVNTTRLDEFSLGKERPLADLLDMLNFDYAHRENLRPVARAMATQAEGAIFATSICEDLAAGRWPPFDDYRAFAHEPAAQVWRTNIRDTLLNRKG